jgi:hypothetical protein
MLRNLKRTTGDIVTDFFKDLSKSFGAFIAHSPRPSFSNEFVNWRNWNNSVFS